MAPDRQLAQKSSLTFDPVEKKKLRKFNSGFGLKRK